MIALLHKHIKILTNKQEQYKGALRTLNQEMKEPKGKLEKEGHQKKKEQEAKVMIKKELMTLLE